jgi:hypothetical protein
VRLDQKDLRHVQDQMDMLALEFPVTSQVKCGDVATGIGTGQKTSTPQTERT